MQLVLKQKDLKIRYSRPGGFKRNYQAIRMMTASSKLKMKQGNEEECIIEKHFKDKYRYQLEFLDYPYLHMENPEKEVYLPIE